MFDIDYFYELLKAHDVTEVRDAFDQAMAAAEQKKKSSTYKYGTHELPMEFYSRLDTNDTTMEDVVLLMYTVLYRDYPELRETLSNVDIAAETKVIADILNVLNAPTDKNVQKLMDQMFGPITKVFTSSDPTANSMNSQDQEKPNLSDKDVVKNFLKFFY